MLSFSDNLKNEISKELPGKKCCMSSLLRGMLFFIKKDVSAGIVFRTKSENTALCFLDLLLIVLNIEAEFKKGKTMFICTVKDLSDIDSINKFLSVDPIICRKCTGFFVKGAFLAAGSVTSPEKAFRIDISVYDSVSATLLNDSLKQPGIIPRISSSGRRYYIKGNEKTTDFLSFIGANYAFYDFINKGIINRMKQDAERANNFEMANLKRSAGSFSRLNEKLAKSDNKYLYDILGEGLYETAVIKKDNPELNLSQIAELHDMEITKSGVYHRLIKIQKKLCG